MIRAKPVQIFFLLHPNLFIFDWRLISRRFPYKGCWISWKLHLNTFSSSPATEWPGTTAFCLHVSYSLYYIKFPKWDRKACAPALQRSLNNSKNGHSVEIRMLTLPSALMPRKCRPHCSFQLCKMLLFEIYLLKKEPICTENIKAVRLLEKLYLCWPLPLSSSTACAKRKS